MTLLAGAPGPGPGLRQFSMGVYGKEFIKAGCCLHHDGSFTVTLTRGLLVVA